MVTKFFCQLPVHLGHLLWHVFLKESHVNVHLTLDLGHPLVHTVIEGHGVSLHGLPHLINERLLLFTPIRCNTASAAP